MTTGKITGINGNMITVKFDGAVAQNEVGYAKLGEQKLMAEIVRVRGEKCDMQVFESTTDLTVGTDVEFTGELLAAELGPGMLTQVYDGLQNPLAELAAEAGKISKDASFFLQRGMYLPGLPRDRKWDFHPTAKVGDKVQAGDELGWVTEGIFDNKTMPGHKIMVPFAFRGTYTVKSIVPAGDYTVTDTIAELESSSDTQSPNNSKTQTLLVLAPRHFEKADAVEENIRKAGFACVRRSREVEKRGVGGQRCEDSAVHLHLSSPPVYLADTTGELMGLYGIADFVFVGKSLSCHGGQNMIEPCLCGKPTVVGPNTENFRPVMSDLLAARGIVQVDDEGSLERTICDWFENGDNGLGERAAQAVRRRLGVVSDCVASIREALK